MIVVARADGYLSLHYGILSPLSVLAFVLWIYEVNIAVISKCDIGCLYITSNKMKHGVVAVSSLCLSAVAGKHNVLASLTKTYESQSARLHFYCVWCSLSRLWSSYRLVIRIIHPIH